MTLHPVKALMLGLAVFSGCFCFAQTCSNIAVPAYFYPSEPGSQWDTAVADAPLPEGRSRILILNPNSGPGSSRDPNYVKAIRKVHDAGEGFLVYGYVHTSYGKRPLAKVEAEIDKYYSWYKVDGIFVDETASAASRIGSYYQPLADYITNKKARAGVMLNPGVYPAEDYINISVPSDSMLVVNVFEDAYANYVNATVPSWALNYPSNRFSHLVYSATAEEMRKAVSLSTRRNAGWIFVTDLGLPNPWQALPSYWSGLTKRVKNGCSDR